MDDRARRDETRRRRARRRRRTSQCEARSDFRDIPTHTTQHRLWEFQRLVRSGLMGLVWPACAVTICGRARRFWLRSGGGESRSGVGSKGQVMSLQPPESIRPRRLKAQRVSRMAMAAEESCPQRQYLDERPADCQSLVPPRDSVRHGFLDQRHEMRGRERFEPPRVRLVWLASLSDRARHQATWTM